MELELSRVKRGHRATSHDISLTHDLACGHQDVRKAYHEARGHQREGKRRRQSLFAPAKSERNGLLI